MFRDITIGQYYQVDSPIHRLDPRVKLAGVIVYIASIFIINNIWGFLFLTAALAALLLLSKVPLPYILRGMRFVWFIVVLAVVFNVLFTEGDHMLWRWWIFKVSTRGILQAVFFALRLLYVIVGTSMLTYTTTPTSLTAGMERVFSHLKFIRFPAHEISMMISIALRFIPILSEEVDKIIKAQTARGADFETGGIVARAKAMIPILVPLFVSAFRRATDLATAMEARGYRGGEGRTKMYPLQYASRDKRAYLILLAYLLLAVAVRVMMDAWLVWGRV